MFLGDTQLKQIIQELKLNSCKFEVDGIIKDLEEKGAASEYLDFTDVDNQQLCIKLDEDTYLYSQQTMISYDWDLDSNRDVKDYYTETYNINKEEISTLISGFYSSLDDLILEVGDQWKQIAIECVFEDEALGN